jgi:hypothetical protein
MTSNGQVSANYLGTEPVGLRISNLQNQNIDYHALDTEYESLQHSIKEIMKLGSQSLF